MANHCIEVVCAGCGRHWCLRGCSFRYPPDEDRAKLVRARHAEKNEWVFENETCCEGFPVLWDSILYRDQ